MKYSDIRAANRLKERIEENRLVIKRLDRSSAYVLSGVFDRSPFVLENDIAQLALQTQIEDDEKELKKLGIEFDEVEQ